MAIDSPFGGRPRPAPAHASLFLRDDALRRGSAGVVDAARLILADMDAVLDAEGLNRSHREVLALIAAEPGLGMGALQARLPLSKQNVHRLTATLLERGLIRQKAGRDDRRRRLFYLTEAGEALDRRLFDAVRGRIKQAYRQAGPEAVNGFWLVVEALAGGR
ncbi:hypothetical protein CCR80_12805 [Rhodothalassium salexigens]|uniref:MarR family winged helix-turn-helix transcriptional regulator n=1 Tax=Rhodothalassium salexigens TaxID=1086 RepID=UPI001911DD29|nr:MarR family transcriptional regulator [Rhodothalassium salexigens]MBK5921912.1 hypothetical protein [Rhodothalassium salexigens]